MVPDVDVSTIVYYDRKAPFLADGYEGAEMGHTHRNPIRHLTEGGKVLEVGCGSGRDAAFLLSHGFDITGVDASAEMVKASIAKHPELAGLVHQASFPFSDDNPILEQHFDAVVMIATLMHISDQDLFECASQIRQLLIPDGILFVSSSLGREGIIKGRDSEGRIYIERQPDEIQLLFERLGFRVITTYRNKDSLGRNFDWITLVLQRIGGSTLRSIDEIETIISRDRKDATYKLALLRALSDIAQTEHYQVRWQSNGRVSVPLGLVAEKWLLYYWPLIEADVETDTVIIPQKRGMEINKPIAFRKAMRSLISFYRPYGGLNSFYQDYKSGSIPSAGLILLDEAVNAIARTIVVGPVQYAGGALNAQDSYFGFQGRQTAMGRCTNPVAITEGLGRILVSAGAWREMTLIGHWLSESLILRWAELTHEISNKTVPIKEVVDRLLVRPTSDRDVQFARSIYANLQSLECVWTGALITRQFAVDHAVPFTLWHNNDLWNLVPAARDVNAKKSDKLISKRALTKSRDRIIYYWEILRNNAENRFSMEVSRTLVRGAMDMKNWKQGAFLGLVENVETLAVQRGLERWEPPDSSDCR